MLVKAFVKLQEKGFGFANPVDKTQSVYIPHSLCANLWHGDIVEVLFTEDETGRRKAKSVQVLDTPFRKYIAQYNTDPLDDLATLYPENNKLPKLKVNKDESINDRDLLMIEVDMTTKTPVIVENFGSISQSLIENKIAIKLLDINSVIPECKDIAVVDYSNKTDFTHVNFVTIDSESTKDIDDAIAVHKINNNTIDIYVAIADVSSFIQPDSYLDQQAMNSTTTYYLPGMTIDMLPHELSSDQCSLVEGKKRPALVFKARITDGIMEKYEFVDSFINVKKRLTYDQVDKVINGDIEIDQEISNIIFNLKEGFDAINKLIPSGIREFKYNNGYWKLDKHYKYSHYVNKEYGIANQIVEKYMLIANMNAADFLLKNDVQGIFRNNDVPSIEEIKKAQDFLMSNSLDFPENPTTEDYDSLIKNVKGTVLEGAVSYILKKTLKPSLYEPINKGHYSLGYQAYTHFTSPIRRYSDLVVHRLIKAKLKNEVIDIDLEKICLKCVNNEIKAKKAYRYVDNKLKVQFMKRYENEIFSAVVTNINDKGLSATLNDFPVDIWIPMSVLGSNLKFDEKTLSLCNESDNFYLGKSINILIKSINLNTFYINSELSKEPEQNFDNLNI